MATVDHAVLAEYARVDGGGLLTIVGGGFGNVNVDTFPAQQQVFVAIRLLLDQGDDDVQLELTLTPPDGGYEMNVGGGVDRPTNATVIDGRVPVQLAVGVGVPLTSAGFYVFDVKLNGVSQRLLKFLASQLDHAE